MNARRLAIGGALSAILALAGCSSEDSKLTLISAGKMVVETLKPKQKSRNDPDLVMRLAARALSRTDRPLMIVSLPSVGAEGVLTVIETNGDYRTWAPWGRGERRTVVTKRGIITATRAIPPDLMSADVDEVLALVERREEGSARYTQRYLSGDFAIVEAKSNCTISRGYEKFVEIGEIRAPVLQMFSSCISAERQFTDLFLVSDTGRILQSRQWLGPVLGFATTRHLR